VRYVALGDSYTLGVSVSPSERWPEQLVQRLAEGDAGLLDLVHNLAVERHTSADLVREQLPRLNEVHAEFVSLLVGAEDIVQDVPENAFAENVAAILDELRGRLAANRLLTVAIPDFTVGPGAAELGDPARNSAAIARANEIVGEAAAARGVAFVAEPFAISREAVEDRALIAPDGLHPSGAQYARWADAIAPVVERLLG
jgi:lysophospholipase L1-like esterase